MSNETVVLLAYILDRMIGDPRSLPHPVVYMGKWILWLEKGIRRWIRQEKYLKPAGVLLPVILVGGSYLLTDVMIRVTGLIHPWLSSAVEIWLISTTIAAKGLADAGIEVCRLLIEGNLQAARHALSMIVGRDTHQLAMNEVSRGAIETVAENLVDGVISPIFYALVGGAPLAMAYRAANTLDSMVGYKNQRYKNLGWAPAKFDDLANYVPARISAVMLVIASIFLRLDWRRSWQVMQRDARLHPSPNSGFPEAAAAGALGIQLGGVNYYQGLPSDRARMGDATRLIEPNDIVKTVDLMYVASHLFIATSLLVLGIFKWGGWID